MTSDILVQTQLKYLRRAGTIGLLRHLNGLRVCATGKASVTRPQLAVLIEAAGGIFTDTLRRDTEVLIVPTVATNSTKVRRAQALGVRIMTEEAFIQSILPAPEDLRAGVRADAAL